MKKVRQEEKFFTNHNLGCVIVTSDEPWSEVWMPQLHYAYQLSKRYNVLFLGPPESWSIKSLFRFRHTSKKYNDRLVLIRYLNVIPLSFGRIAIYINDKINEWQIKKRISSDFNLPKLILWRFDPARSLYLFGNKNTARQVFHVIDPIVGYGLDIPLSKKAELIVITSPKFIDHYRALNKNVIHIVQGVDMDFYRNASHSVHENTTVSNDAVLLLGSFTDDLDYKFLKKLAHHVATKLVLIGPKKVSRPEKELTFSDLIQTGNVHWLGAMEPSRFYSHLVACKVGIIAYDNEGKPVNKLRSPLKAIGYLAAHKCVISNIDCEIPSLVNKAIYLVQDESSFLAMIDKCFSGDLLFDQVAVDNYLYSIDYNNLLIRIFEKLGEKLPPVIEPNIPKSIDT